MASTTDIVHAYRHLYRGLLRAVIYAKPERFIVRDILRSSFRDEKAVFQPETVKRTTWFIQTAGRTRGLEHRIIKNLLRMHMAKHKELKKWRTVHARSLRSDPLKAVATPYRHFEMTLAMLNATMGIALR
ncbi:hypothetical protein B0I35DRAFT_408841 [Stachybotrys elegans]|uniref:Uncharacterized protein n=1 Tax=Stachybotrys elegans TaxID=80388 RepID=A0A8K0ST34_9HYPO|nr:hypothetical protein B0I35DRAFT_408841 [Stachybotrys elegans]